MSGPSSADRRILVALPVTDAWNATVRNEATRQQRKKFHLPLLLNDFERMATHFPLHLRPVPAAVRRAQWGGGGVAQSMSLVAMSFATPMIMNSNGPAPVLAKDLLSPRRIGIASPL